MFFSTEKKREIFAHLFLVFSFWQLWAIYLFVLWTVCFNGPWKVELWPKSTSYFEVNNTIFEFWRVLASISHYTLGLGKQTNKWGLVTSYLLEWSLCVFGSKNEGCLPGTQNEVELILRWLPVHGQWWLSNSPQLHLWVGEDNVHSCKGKCLSLFVDFWGLYRHSPGLLTNR